MNGRSPRGEWLFRAAAVSAGSTVVVVIALIAIFLLVRAFPSLLANEANFFTSPEFLTNDPDHLSFGIRDLLMVTVLSSVFALALAVLMCAGLACVMQSTHVAATLVLVVMMQFVVAPISAHMLGRATYRLGQTDYEAIVVDEYAEDLERARQQVAQNGSSDDPSSSVDR